MTGQPPPNGHEPAQGEALIRDIVGKAPEFDVDDDAAVAGIAPPLSDDDLALRFTEQHRGRLRYVAAWGKWLEWNGVKWKTDETKRTEDLARLVCRDATRDELKPKEAEKIASALKVAAVVKLASADRRHARRTGDWDQDPWLLNTPGGLWDLRTGERIGDCDPNRNCTKATAVAPATERGGACDRWLAFLSDVTNGDAELQDYLQRVVGYCLTGSIREHAFFFAYGPGGNGKGVFVNTLQAILGDYATVAEAEMFTASPHDRHPTELAKLRGARLVTAQETEEGRRWAEAKVKALTGGDRISARFMRQDFFEFDPTFKLFVVGNHRPALRNVDAAMKRRLHVIPFRFQPPNPDPELQARLRDEWPGILAWAIEGARHWHRIGLGKPEIVQAETADYFEQEDTVGRWIRECCDLANPDAKTPVAHLFKSWTKWTAGNGEFTGSIKRFSGLLAQKGFERGSAGPFRYFIGLRLMPDPDEGSDAAAADGGDHVADD
jgi:putative DNA primase/helicase